MERKTKFICNFLNLITHISSIKAKILFLLFGWPRSSDLDFLNSVAGKLDIMAVSTINYSTERNAFCISEYASFGTTFSSVDGAWSCFFSAKRSFGHCPVH